MSALPRLRKVDTSVRKREGDMDVFLIIVGIVFIVVGIKKKDSGDATSGWKTQREGNRRGWLAMLIIGSIITFLGALLFSATFIAAYIAAYLKARN
jgi:hypothetical protein